MATLPLMPPRSACMNSREVSAGDVALALQRLLVRVHRIGHVDGEHELGIDRDGVRGAVGDRLVTGAAPLFQAATAKGASRRPRQTWRPSRTARMEALEGPGHKGMVARLPSPEESGR